MPGTLHIPLPALKVLEITAQAGPYDLGLVLYTALDQFIRLPADSRRGLLAEFLALGTGPRRETPVPARLLQDFGRWCGKTGANAVLCALWHFSRFSLEDRLALCQRAALRG